MYQILLDEVSIELDIEKSVLTLVCYPCRINGDVAICKCEIPFDLDNRFHPKPYSFKLPSIKSIEDELQRSNPQVLLPIKLEADVEDLKNAIILGLALQLLDIVDEARDTKEKIQAVLNGELNDEDK